MEKAIVLKNIRRDIPAMKPLAAKVIQLQRQLIEAVQRYQVSLYDYSLTIFCISSLISSKGCTYALDTAS